MPHFWAIVEWLPVGSYPVQQSFRHRSLVLLISVCCVLTFCALAAWNVATQGRDKIFTPVFLQEYIGNASTSCQTTRVNVGDTVFMFPFGNFSWVLNGVDRGHGFETGFDYTGGKLQDVRVTSVGLTYQFAAQNYNYGICANASVPTSSADISSTPRVEALPASPDNTVLSFCTNYDLSVANLPHWTAAATQRIENRIYGIANFWQNLTFHNGTFPTALVPPYGAEGSPPPADTTVTPASVLLLNIYLQGFAYLPILNPNLTADFGNEHPILFNGTEMTLNQTFDKAVTYASPPLGGGIGFTVNGIGNIHINTNATNTAIGFKEPEIFTKLRAYSINVVNLMMDMSIQDLDGVPIAESYLCTITSTRWKGALAMIAMVLGNSAGVFGVAFAVMMAFARLYDARVREKELDVAARLANAESGSGAGDSTEKVYEDENSNSTQEQLSPISPATAVATSPTTAVA